MSDVTQVCLLTAKGRSAVAVVGVRGPAAIQYVEKHFRSASGLPLSELPLSKIAYGHWQGEDLIVCPLANQRVEVHCHGGYQSPARIIAALVDDGAEHVEWEEWLEDEPGSLLQHEAELALGHAKTQRTADYLLRQYHGRLEEEIREIKKLLSSVSRGGDSAGGRITTLLGRGEFGLHLTQPWQVVIAGEPNVGKSSLINALLGYERAIVFDQPGTTRDVVSATTALDGWPVELFDTAGMHATDDPLESAGIDLARQQVEQADLVLWLLDATCSDLAGKFTAEAIVSRQADAMGLSIDTQKLLVVINKIDLAPPPVDLAADVCRVSATTGESIAELITAAATRLVPEVPDPQSAIPFTQRQIKLLQLALEPCQSGKNEAALAVLEPLTR